ncbi:MULTISPECIES: YceI family protein [Acinetobacter]|uniref:YceI family protein n=1 Tax=Acinetobacter pecorum TaxID=2762215 RepID=A0ABR8VWQ4_9GAMM|nr:MULTISPECIES: YceI family protein [Acinetobacter]MBD8009127.1 YceI family protein [Acinetobacter pecorum]
MKTIIKTGLLSLAICLALISQSFARSWTLTPKSDVGFEIKSMGLTMVKAKFNQVQSTMQFDANAPQNASTHLVMDVESLSFSKPVFKNMILGEDLFYVAKYKTVIFKSIQFKDLGNGKYKVLGHLTLRGVTKPVIFETTFKPSMSDANLLDVQASAVINRSDFGMKKGIAGIGDKVNLHLSGQCEVN